MSFVGYSRKVNVLAVAHVALSFTLISLFVLPYICTSRNWFSFSNFSLPQSNTQCLLPPNSDQVRTAVASLILKLDYLSRREMHQNFNLLLILFQRRKRKYHLGEETWVIL